MLSTFVDNAALLSTSTDYDIAMSTLQSSLDAVAAWSHKRRIKLSGEMSVNITFTLQLHPHTLVLIDSSVISYRSTVKYLRVHLDEHLTYSAHVHAKCWELDLQLCNISWFLRRSSRLLLSNKRLLYLSVIHPI